MHLPEIERLTNRLDLGNEPRYLPERQVVRFLGAPGAELIVADDVKAFVGKIEKRRQILEVAARSTMQQQQGAGPFARTLIPDSAIADVDKSLLAHIHKLSKVPHVATRPATD